MLVNLKKFFGPIRKCIKVAPNSFVCVVRTPGFTKEELQSTITHNGLFTIDGDTRIIEDGLCLYRSRVHEAIELPPRVRRDTILWDTKDGLTIFRCRNDSP